MSIMEFPNHFLLTIYNKINVDFCRNLIKSLFFSVLNNMSFENKSWLAEQNFNLKLRIEYKP